MLTTDQLLALLSDHESEAVELTTSTNNTGKFCQAICAFANDFPDSRQPGYLLVGVNDDRTASGLNVTDQLLRRLGDLRSNVNLEPLPAMSVQKHTLPEGEIAVVEVLPSDLPPVRYKGRVWIRVGPSRRGANQQEERTLVEKRTALQRTFDVRPCQGCTLDDLVLDLFSVTYLPAAVEREVIAENQRSIPEQMASPENFPRQTDYRNPAIAEAMATLGYVNHFGRGVIRAQEALRRNGNPEATFTFDPSHVLATIESKP